MDRTLHHRAVAVGWLARKKKRGAFKLSCGVAAGGPALPARLLRLPLGCPPATRGPRHAVSHSVTGPGRPSPQALHRSAFAAHPPTN